MSLKRITVGICTWNRAQHLDQTLAEMMKMRIPDGVNWELLVVNNGSSDETDAVIARYTNTLPIRRLFESRQGKSHACNLLVREATGDLVLWTDDDVLVAPDWMEQYVLAATRYSEATFFGGTVEPRFEIAPPDWILRTLPQLEGPLAVMQHGAEVRPVRADEHLAGANMAMRTEVLRRNPFDTRLGPTGKQLLRGEDTRLVRTLQAQGQLGMWVGPARVRHWVPKARMTTRYVWDWFYQEGITKAQTDPISGKRLFGVPRWALRKYVGSIMSWAWGCVFDVRRRVSALRQWAHYAGLLAELRRRWPDSKGSDGDLIREVVS